LPAELIGLPSTIHPVGETVVKQVISFVCLFFLANVAFAEAGFQFAAPNVNAPDDPVVNGMRFSLLRGKNQSMSGLDLGLLSMSETSKMSGLAFVAGVHKVTGEMSSGVAFSLMNYHTGTDTGVNGAFINLLNDTSGAFNLGFVTIAEGATLVDLGGINMSKSSTAQIGFLNITQQIKSFQFGFLNMAENGFLPMFPIFNFPKSN
jgi:hypothetical protein